MKNMYLYGAGDDCREIETDFGLDCESYEDIIIFHKTGAIIAHYVYEGDWGVQLIGDPPLSWKIRAIEGNAPLGFRGYADAGQFIHIQIPDDEAIKLKPMGEDKARETYGQAFSGLKNREKN